MLEKIKKLPNILKLGAAVLGLIAFFLMFANQVSIQILGNTHEFSFSVVLFGGKDGINYNGAVGGFIGYLLVLFAACGSCCTVFVETKYNKWIVVASAVLFVVGAILVFCVVPMWASANDASSTDGLSLLAGPVVAGIFALLGAGATCGSLFVKA